MVFMKGNPTNPRCKFSKALVRFLMGKNIVRFGYFDVLQDQIVREALKVYSNWVTYPQVYIKGELVGGLDVVQELDAQGELLPKVPAECLGKGLFPRVKAIIDSKPVMLFMQGTPDAPQTEDDRQAVQLLRELGVEFGWFDVSAADAEEIRLGHQQYALSKGYPQLWAHGQHVGNLDAMLAKHRDGALVQLVGLTPAPANQDTAASAATPSQSATPDGPASRSS